MEVSAAVAPPLGTANPGDLYVDMPTRQLWLGVPTSLDPSGSVLVSDIVAFQTSLTANLNTAKAYTDSQLAAYPPMVARGDGTRPHTHKYADIIDFAAGVAASTPPGAELPVGSIIIWYGLPGDVGQGALAKWHVCDGLGGTPDLRDRFIIGAGGGKAHKSFNALGTFDTDNKGQHSHSGQTDLYTLTLADIPVHAHSIPALSGSASGNTNVAGAHTHTYPYNLITAGAGPAPQLTNQTYGNDGNLASSQATYTGAGASGTDHYHGFSGSVVTNANNTGNQGSGGAHRHPISQDGGHVHTITAQQIRDTVPYYALLYIMKVS